MPGSNPGIGAIAPAVAAIKLVTDLIPNAGAMTSIAQDGTVAKEATSALIQAKTAGLPVDPASQAAIGVQLAALLAAMGLPVDPASQAAIGVQLAAQLAAIGVQLAAQLAALGLPVDPASQAAIGVQLAALGLPVDPASQAAIGVQLAALGLPVDPASQAAIGVQLAALPKAFFMDFWSDPIAKITVPQVAAPVDLTFPDVVVASLPGDLTIIRVVAILKVRSIKDISAADNYINAANKKLRIKASGGVWGAGDIIAIDFTNGQWYTAASTKEGGDVMVGDNDIKSVVSADDTYNFRSDQTNRGDAIVALGASLELYDVQTGIRVYLKTP